MEMRLVKKIIGFLTFCMFCSPVFASEASVPNEFRSGTPAVASEVNENFSALKSAIDDNNSRINDIETEIDIASAVIGTWTTKSFNNGYTGEQGSVTFHSNGSFTVNGGTLSILRGCAIQECGSLGGTWEVIENTVIEMKLDGIDPMSNEKYEPSFPFVVKVLPNKVSLSRSSNFTILIRQ